MSDTKDTAGAGGRGARRRILAAAADLFYREGINATGVERLAAESAVSKRTLYQHFPSKTAVVEEYLRSVEESIGDPAQAVDSPRERLLAHFQIPDLGGAAPRGCPFHNAAVEAAGAMPGVHDIVRRVKHKFADRLAELAGEAGAPDPQ